jgi:class 3 adenylate cyclase/tetratricopeptide (TPR) repeat protein
MAGLSRKTVTVLFADIVNWTPLGETLDPESVRAFQTRLFDEVRAVIERHGGTVEKYMGDAVMAVFGVPYVHEDDALRAVRAADEMRAALARVNATAARPVSLRTGVNTGEVVAGGGHALVTGDAVNVAARLEKAAGPGEILIGAQTYELVRDAVLAESLEPLEVKGKSTRVVAWRVTAVIRDTPGRARRLDAELVGRAGELALLRQAFARVAGSRVPYLFTLVGMAGVGKSRLARELVREVQRESARALVGRCIAYGEGITFWPLRDIAHAVGDVEALVGKQAAEAILGAIGQAETPPPRDQTFRAVRRLLETLTHDRPLVVVFDDLQWAEPTFLDLVEYLAESLHDAPALILCLARPEFYEGRPAWGGGKLNATTISLEPLDADEADRLIDVLGGHDIDDRLRRTITETAEGNPLFIEEMMVMVADDPTAATVPPTINAVLRARLERLERDELAVLTAASVVGRFFSRDAVATLVADADPVLASLERKELIRTQRVPFSERPEYRFRHILIRDAAYDSLPKARRAEMHERVADWLEREATDADELVGWHLEQAVRYRSELGNSDAELARTAAAVLGAVGLRALARNDARAAVTLLGRAVSILEPGDPARLELQAELGGALMKTGEFVRADETLAEAVTAHEPRVRLRASVDREFVRSYLQPESGSDTLVRVAEAVIPQLEQLGDDVGLAKAWWLLSEAHSIACRWQARADALERALEHARNADAWMPATYIALLAQALYYGPTPVDEAFARCESLAAEAEGNPTVEAAVTSVLAGLLAMRGDFAEARASWARAAAIYDELGLHFPRAARSLIAAEIELLAGDGAQAVHELERGYELLEAMGERGVRSTLAAILARTLASEGRYDEADRYVRASEEVAASDDLVTQAACRAARAEVLAQNGDLAAAEETALDAVAIAGQTDFLDLQARTYLSLAAVIRAAGRDGEADETLSRATAIFEQKGNLVAARLSAGASSPSR